MTFLFKRFVKPLCVLIAYGLIQGMLISSGHPLLALAWSSAVPGYFIRQFFFRSTSWPKFAGIYGGLALASLAARSILFLGVAPGVGAAAAGAAADTAAHVTRAAAVAHEAKKAAPAVVQTGTLAEAARWWAAMAVYVGAVLLALHYSLFRRTPWLRFLGGVVGVLVGSTLITYAGVLIGNTTWVSVALWFASVIGLTWAARAWSQSGGGDTVQLANPGGGWSFGGLRPGKGQPDGRAQHTGTGKYGTAAWGTAAHLATAEDGLLLGRDLNDPHKVLRFDQNGGHLVTVAPPRAGKGVSAVVPNLLTYPGSVFVNDPKVELVEITAAARAAMGQQVHIFDPFDQAGGRARYNPLDMIDHTAEICVSDAMVLAEMLVLSQAKSTSDSGEFFKDNCKSLFAAILLHICSSEVGPRRTIPRLRELVTMPDTRMGELWTHMAESRHCYGIIERAGNAMLDARAKEPKLYMNVLQTLKTHTAWLDMPQLVRALGESNCDLRDLKRDLATFFMVLPPDQQKTCARWVRLLMGCAVLGMTRQRGRPYGGRDVLFMLDELAQLGPIESFESWYTQLPGYGLKFWLVLQDLGQLEKLYGEEVAGTLLNGAAVLQAFRINDLKTAKKLEERMGEMTISVEQSNEGTSGKAFDLLHTGQTGTSTSETGRALMFVSEIMQLPKDQQLLFIAGEQPVRARKLTYYSDPEFAGLWAETTMHATA